MQATGPQSKRVEDDWHRMALQAWELRQSDPEASREQADRVAREAPAERAPLARAWSEITRAWHLGIRGNEAQFKARLAAPIGCFTVQDDRRGLAVAWMQLARCALATREYDRAESLLRQIESLDAPLDPSERADLLMTASHCAGVQGKTGDAIQHLASAFDCLPSGFTTMKFRMLNNLANLCADLGDNEVAAQAFILASEMARRHAPQDVVLIEIGAMTALAFSGDVREAVHRAHSIMPSLREIAARVPPVGRTIGYSLAFVYACAGDAARARECLDVAHDAVPPRPNDLQLEATRARIALAEDDLPAASMLATAVLANAGPDNTVSARLCIDILIECARRRGDTAGVSALQRKRLEIPPRTSLVARALVTQLRQSFEGSVHGELLSERERACLSLAARGQTSRDIADKLGINQRTVDFHFANIVRKLNVLNRQEAIAKAAMGQWLH